MLAELLDLPQVTVAVKIELGDGKAIVEREVDGGREIWETPLPAVVSAQKGLNEPRYASLKGIMAAKKKPIQVARRRRARPRRRGARAEGEGHGDGAAALAPAGPDDRGRRGGAGERAHPPPPRRSEGHLGDLERDHGHHPHVCRAARREAAPRVARDRLRGAPARRRAGRERGRRRDRPGRRVARRRAGLVRGRLASTSSTTPASRPTRPSRTRARSRRRWAKPKAVGRPRPVHRGRARTSRRGSPRSSAPGSRPTAWPSRVKDGRLSARRPMYAGKAYATVEWAGEPQIATLRPNVFPLGQPDASRKAQVVKSTADCVRAREGHGGARPRPRARCS